MLKLPIAPPREKYQYDFNLLRWHRKIKHFASFNMMCRLTWSTQPTQNLVGKKRRKIFDFDHQGASNENFNDSRFLVGPSLVGNTTLAGFVMSLSVSAFGTGGPNNAGL